MNLAELSNKYRKYKILPLLLGIFLLGFSIRYLAAGPRIGPELDTWFHYRMVNHVLVDGHIPEIDTLSYYPTGRPLRNADLLGLPYFIAYAYRAFSFTGITVMDFMVAFPAIFTSLAAIPLYLLTKEIFGGKAGLLAALFWQIIPSTLTRTHAGFVDKETLASIYIFIWLWLFILSIRILDPRESKTLITPAISGIFMGLSAWTWGGTSYFLILISTSAFFYLVLKIRELKESVGYSLIIMTVFGAITMTLLQPQRIGIYKFYNELYYLSLSGVSLLYGVLILNNIITTKMDEDKSKYFRASSLIFIFVGASISGRLQYLFGSFYRFVKGKVLLDKSLIGATVSENLSPSFYGGGNSFLKRVISGDWYSHFNLVLFVIPIGLLLLLQLHKRRGDYGSLFVIFFVISGILGMRSDIRLSFVLTPSLAMIAAFTASFVISNLQEREISLKRLIESSKKKKIRYKAETQMSNMKVAKLLVIVIILGVVASPTVASFSMLNGRKVDVPVPWYNAMMWIKDNTPEDAVIVSWWDYGYWEQALAKRRTVVDGGNAGPLVYNTGYTEGLEYRGSTHHRDVDMAKMFTSPEDEALLYLRPYVDYEKVPTYLIVSYEEFGKSGAINHISQCSCLYIFPQSFPRSDDPSEDQKLINDFITNNAIESYSSIVNFGSYWQIWFTGFDPNAAMMPDPEMKNRLLNKLLPLSMGYGQGLEHFELVYQDEWDYVLIYRVV